MGRYELADPGIESRWGGEGAKICALVPTGPGAHPDFCLLVTENLPGRKALGTWR